MTTETKLDKIIELLAMLVSTQTINAEPTNRHSPFDDVATPAEHE